MRYSSWKHKLYITFQCSLLPKTDTLNIRDVWIDYLRLHRNTASRRVMWGQGTWYWRRIENTSPAGTSLTPPLMDSFSTFSSRTIPITEVRISTTRIMILKQGSFGVTFSSLKFSVTGLRLVRCQALAFFFFLSENCAWRNVGLQTWTFDIVNLG